MSREPGLRIRLSGSTLAVAPYFFGLRLACHIGLPSHRGKPHGREVQDGLLKWTGTVVDLIFGLLAVID